MITSDIVEMFDLPLKDYYICYFDVLGYKAFFENNPNEHKKFLVEMLVVIADIKSEILKKQDITEICFRSYSDNFLIFIEKNLISEYDALRLLCKMIRNIQIRLLMNCYVLVRGSITVGEFFVNEQIVFGQGLIKAVFLEDKVAINPRIIIDKDCFDNSIIEQLATENVLIKDSDGNFFVNYLSSVGKLKLTKGKCEALIDKHCKYHPLIKEQNEILQIEKIISKYLWLLVYFNQQCDNLNNPEFKIKYILKINEQLLKTEIICDRKTNN